jgi:hypothetical protein
MPGVFKPIVSFRFFTLECEGGRKPGIGGNKILIHCQHSLELFFGFFECADGGWTNFNFPNAFNNQGECVAFVQSKKNRE